MKYNRMKSATIPEGYAPAAYGSSEEVWHRSMKNLADLTVRTIKELYRSRAYSESYDRLHKTLYGNPNDPFNDSIKKRLRDDPFGSFRSDRFYNTFNHWCEYYGNDKDNTRSYFDLIEKDDFMKELLDKVEKHFVDEYHLTVPHIKIRPDLPEAEIRSAEYKAKQAIHDRIVTPSARRFTPEQIDILKHYRAMFTADTSTSELFTRLYENTIKNPEVAAKSDKWKTDVWNELVDLARGEKNQEQRGIRL